MTKLKFKSVQNSGGIFKSSNRFNFFIIFLKKFFCKILYNFFLKYIKMSGNSSAKYYQGNKERPQKRDRKR